MGEDFIRTIKDPYRRSQQQRLAKAAQLSNLFDSSSPPATLYPCTANDESVPVEGTALALCMDNCEVQVLAGNRIVAVVAPESAGELIAEIQARPALQGYVEAKVVKSYPKAKRFDVLPQFKTGAGES